MERQSHGFTYEEYIKGKYNIRPFEKGNYICKWDGILNGYPVSIKTEKIGSDVEMASFLRNATNTDSFYLFVGFWEKQKSNVVKEVILFIDGNEWHQLFDVDIVNECEELVRTISNASSDDERWKNEITALRKRWTKNTSNLIRPRFKRDHKGQKRMQCAINNKDFFKYFVPKYGIGEEL